MSACMRALYSSDQCAPGLSFAFACGWGICGAFFSTGGRRAAVFNFKVVRGVVELEDELESLMQVFETPSWWWRGCAGVDRADGYGWREILDFRCDDYRSQRIISNPGMAGQNHATEIAVSARMTP